LVDRANDNAYHLRYILNRTPDARTESAFHQGRRQRPARRGPRRVAEELASMALDQLGNLPDGDVAF
jgi:hypothetical protein